MAIGMNKNAVEMLLAIKTHGLAAFISGMNHTRKKLAEVVTTVRQTSAALAPLSKDLSVFGNAKHQQAIEGMKTRYNNLNKSLMPLADNTKEALMANVKPSMTAEQSVQGLLNKQKELSTWSRQYGKEMNSNDNVARRLINSNDSLGGSLGMNMEQYKAVQTSGQKMNTTMGRFGMKIRSATHGLRGFRMELLGVMFFGMGVQKFFTGMLRPTAELFGIFELWKVLLQVTFLPVMEDLFAIFLKFFEHVLGWSDTTKTFVGWFVFFGAVLGATLFLIGMMGLGIGSLIMAFGFLGIAVTAGSLGVWGLAALVVIGIIALMISKHLVLRMGLIKIELAYIKLTFRLRTAFLAWREWQRAISGSTRFDEEISQLKELLGSEESTYDKLLAEWDSLNKRRLNSTSDSNQKIKTELIGLNNQMSNENTKLTETFIDGEDMKLTAAIKTFTDFSTFSTATYADEVFKAWAFSAEVTDAFSSIGRRGGSAALQTEASAVDSLIAYGTSQEGGWRDPSASQSINVVNNVTVSDPAEQERWGNEFTKKLADDLAVAPKAQGA